METEEKKMRPGLKRLVIFGICALPVLLFLIISPIKPAANFVTNYFSRPVKVGLGAVMSLLPFSFMELEYIAAAVFLLWYLIRTVVLTARAQGSLRVFGRRILSLLLVLLCVFDFFLWCFAIDYRADSFTERSGMEGGPVETEDLYAVTKLFIRNAARYAQDVKRDDEGHWAEDLDGYLEKSKTVYENLSFEFPFLPTKSRVPKKMFLTSRLSSWMGFTGVYFPFSAESNINIDAPGCLIPETICHELAHQKGITSEQEANFVGIRAAIASGDPVYAYSGLLAGSIYLSNALYSADPDAWYELSALITGPMRVDWNDNNSYWKQFEGKVEEVSSKVYDGYLKAQGQELGIRSYGACVNLLVEYYTDMAHAYEAAE